MFQQCAQPEFRAYAQAVVINAKAMAAGLMRRGLELTTGGTDNHLMVIDIRPTGLRGRQVQAGSDEVGVTVNANAFPATAGPRTTPTASDSCSPAVTSRGMGEAEMDEIAALVARMLGGFDDAAVRAEVRDSSRPLPAIPAAVSRCLHRVIAAAATATGSPWLNACHRSSSRARCASPRSRV